MSTIRFYCGRDSKEIVRKFHQAFSEDNHVQSIEIRHTFLEEDVIDAIVNLVHKGSVDTVHLYDCGAHLNKSAIRMARGLGNCKHVRLTESTFLSTYFLENLLVSADRLTSLRIQDHLLEEQLKALAKGLQNNRTLKTLDLSRSQIDDISILAKGLRNSQIHRLQLRSIGLQDHHAAILMPALESCTMLESLDLSFNNLRNLVSVAKLLLHPYCELRDLRIGYQNLWQTQSMDVSEIRQALKVNTKLRTLKLPRNELDDSSIVVLIDALAHNSALENLDLRENNLSDVGVILLAELALVSNGLKRLLVCDNAFGTDASLVLLNAVSKNYNLEHIDGSCNVQDEHINKQIRYHTALNRGGRKLLVGEPPLALWPLAMNGTRYHPEEKDINQAYTFADVTLGATDPEIIQRDIDILHADVLYYLLKETSARFFY